jgi:hypothetical protein
MDVNDKEMIPDAAAEPNATSFQIHPDEMTNEPKGTELQFMLWLRGVFLRGKIFRSARP